MKAKELKTIDKLIKEAHDNAVKHGFKIASSAWFACVENENKIK